MGEGKYLALIIGFAILFLAAVNFVPLIKTNKLRSDVSVETTYISSINDKSDNFVIKNDGENVIVLSEIGSDGEFKILKYNVKFTKIHKTLSDNDKPYVEVTENEYDGIIKVKMYVPENAEILF